MPNHPHHRQGPQPIPPPQENPEREMPFSPQENPERGIPPSRQEPAVRRWPHPVRMEGCRRDDPFLRYVRCALSYQNQMLADIKALLEQIRLNTDRDDAGEK